ncbi:HNH endonuclease family protein [Streptomyces sp. BI20]|uniref:HNH endonuclease family protein n=1 Tax=Streptomyces sp. BI20 TaxID=3403460 RepID=UPI003C77528D
MRRGTARGSATAMAGALLCALAFGGCARPGPEPGASAAPFARVPLASEGFPPEAATARAWLEKLVVGWGQNWQTYRRAEFEPPGGARWSDETDAVGGRNGCDTRDDVLRRDLTGAREGDRNPCVVLSGVLHDPYTGTELPYSYRRASGIETDHVVALGAAWRGGAWAWTPARRLAYANDLDGLLAVEKRANQEKGSKTADKWRPPRRAYWCEYGRRYVGVKHKYALTVTPPERDALRELLTTCR